MRVLSIGEVLWDVYPDRELLGGAAFNFAANIHRLGGTSALISGIGNDERGRRASEIMTRSGIITDGVQVVQNAPTGTAIVRLHNGCVPAFEIQRPAAYDMRTFSLDVSDWAYRFNADWFYFGTLVHMNPSVEEFTTAFARGSRGLRCLYDVNLRNDNWNLMLVKRLCRLANVFKLNLEESRTLFEASGFAKAEFSLELFCTRWASEFSFDIVCVTLGAEGCCVYADGRLWKTPGYSVQVRDTVGSGDAFAAGFLYAYDRGWPIPKASRLANALGALVASRSGATPEVTLDECLAMASLGASPGGEQ